jgi:hypothetical protein
VRIIDSIISPAITCGLPVANNFLLFYYFLFFIKKNTTMLNLSKVEFISFLIINHVMQHHTML